MKPGIVILFSFFMINCMAQDKKFLSFGIDNRFYPVDIEDVPRGPITENGLPDDEKLWKAVSFDCRAGIILRNNWKLSLAGYTRYNHLNWLQGVNLTNPSPVKRNEKKTFKFDIFLDIEKAVRLKKNKERYFIATAGLGFTNINSRFDVFLQDTLPSGPTQGKRYQGTYTHFGPRLSLGYQYERITATLDAYIIEGPSLSDLTSVWPGLTLSYEIGLGKKKK